MEEFSRIKRLPPYVFNVTGELKLAARRRGEDVIDFSMGNPDQPTPRHIVDKLVESVQRTDTHGYSVSKGILRLRKAICNWYQARYGIEFDPDSEAIVTIGSKEGIAHLTLATLDAGDSYVGLVLPGIVTFGVGMAITVAPLTAAVLGAVDDEFVGVASGVSNAVARFAGMLAVAALPAIAGISAAPTLAAGLADGYQEALRIAAVTTALGGLTAAVFVDRTARVRPTATPAVQQSCCDPAVLTERRAA